MKNILIVYPHNFFKRQMGIDSRFYELIKYYNARDFKVDLLSLKNFVSSWDHQDPHDGNLLNELHLYDFLEGYNGEQKKPGALIKKVLERIRGKSPNPISFPELPDYTYRGMKRQFEEILSRRKYDYILISYVYWATLIEPESPQDSTTVLDLSDFTTLNLFDMSEGRINIGKLIEEEIRRVNFFHKVICISEDERSFFSQFCQKPEFYYIPYFMKANQNRQNTKKDIDLLFIGSDNAFNRKGIRWFFDKVYPLLDRSISILIVGKITDHIPKHGNVTAVPYAEDLNRVYRKTKVAICPLLGGTGLKIKVIEALSFGLPVVTTPKGVVGFPQKLNNGCLVSDTPEGFARGIHRLLRDKDYYRQQSEQSNFFFRENFEESRVHRELDRIFFEVG